MNIKTAMKMLKKRDARVTLLNAAGAYRWMPDKMFLHFFYQAKMGKKLNLEDPKTYNEKLQWMKLYDHNPAYPLLVDKYEAKLIVAKKAGEQYIVPLIGVYDRLEQVDFAKLPNAFVLKTTHNSGGVYICPEKEKGVYIKKNGKRLTFAEMQQDVAKQLKSNHFAGSREWAYKEVKPRIIIEEYIGNQVDDYKVMCFQGEPRIVYLESGRLGTVTCDFFDTDFNHLDIRQLNPNANKAYEKPIFLEEMLAVAKKLSADFPQVRVDFFRSGDRLYFAELTFYNWGGFAKFEPEKWDEILGSYFTLPNK